MPSQEGGTQTGQLVRRPSQARGRHMSKNVTHQDQRGVVYHLLGTLSSHCSDEETEAPSNREPHCTTSCPSLKPS